MFPPTRGNMDADSPGCVPPDPAWKSSHGLSHDPHVPKCLIDKAVLRVRRTGLRPVSVWPQRRAGGRDRPWRVVLGSVGGPAGPRDPLAPRLDRPRPALSRGLVGQPIRSGSPVPYGTGGNARSAGVGRIGVDVAGVATWDRLDLGDPAHRYRSGGACPAHFESRRCSFVIDHAIAGRVASQPPPAQQDALARGRATQRQRRSDAGL